MKKILCLLFALILALTLFSACSDPESASLPNSAETKGKTGGVPRGSVDLSTFNAPGLEGGSYSGEIFHGHKLTMLNLWGTYCGPCIREMPDLAALSKEYGDEFQIIGIPLDVVDRNYNLMANKKAEAESILSQTGADYLQILPSASLSKLYLSQVQVVPTTLFLDENGVILEEPHFGSKDYDGWKAIIDAYLEAL